MTDKSENKGTPSRVGKSLTGLSNMKPASPAGTQTQTGNTGGNTGGSNTGKKGS